MMTFSSLWQCWNNSLLSIFLSFSQNIQQSCLVCLVLSKWLAIKSESLFQVHTVHMSLTLLRNFFLPILTPRVTWYAHPSQVISLESLPLLLWQKKGLHSSPLFSPTTANCTHTPISVLSSLARPKFLEGRKCVCLVPQFQHSYNAWHFMGVK